MYKNFIHRSFSKNLALFGIKKIEISIYIENFSFSLYLRGKKGFTFKHSIQHCILNQNQIQIGDNILKIKSE